ncbi:MAG: GGDEF domain-containing protein [Syntrophobacterales bacterium]|nr:GGDEF domain-containing protein [Syntrophobacterales bacterium]
MSSEELVAFVKDLVNSRTLPAIPENCRGNEELEKIFVQMLEIRKAILAFSGGDFSQDIETKGFIAGGLKGLQAHLKHMIWQVQMVAGGDFSQRVEFMGEFAVSFNAMVEQLRSTIEDLQRKEELLSALTNKLQLEIEEKIKIEQALRASEARYKNLASTDALTGLYNRRYFFKAAANEIARIKRNKRSFCLGIMDVDHFKKFNDEYGHQNGDRCLVQIARLALKSIREMDLLARYGGEEFIFLFPEANMEQGFAIAERIRNFIANVPVVMTNSTSASVTVSIGLRLVEEFEGQTTNELLQTAIQQADIALYMAKNKGRDKVIVSYGEEYTI